VEVNRIFTNRPFRALHKVPLSVRHKHIHYTQSLYMHTHTKMETLTYLHFYTATEKFYTHPISPRHSYGQTLNILMTVTGVLSQSLAYIYIYISAPLPPPVLGLELRILHLLGRCSTT
jgi:hypothetical protein